MTDFVGHELGLGDGHEVGEGQDVQALFLHSER